MKTLEELYAELSIKSNYIVDLTARINSLEVDMARLSKIRDDKIGEKNLMKLEIKKIEDQTVKDTIKTTKQIQDLELVVESLLNLRDELFENQSSSELFYKINSCLYKQYPNFPKDKG